jgi:hypothetical protein
MCGRAYRGEKIKMLRGLGVAEEKKERERCVCEYCLTLCIYGMLANHTKKRLRPPNPNANSQPKREPANALYCRKGI